jgi:putative methionine-R-sulfoxide reductase with GAF domain
VAAALRGAVRGSDLVCRVGGEEFAAILPGARSRLAQTVALRLLQAVSSLDLGPVGAVTASVGVAESPVHAADGLDLTACAEAAMMSAKSAGKNRVVVFAEELSERPASGWEGRDTRSLAHLRLLQSLLRKLGRLAPLPEVGAVLVEELRGLIDHDGCSVYALHGEDLAIVALGGDPPEALSCRIGEGAAGAAAESRAPVLIGPGSDRHSLSQSIAAVPIIEGGKCLGVLVASRIGENLFGEHDVRLLEIVASQAAVAFQNAHLHDEALARVAQAERDAEGLRTTLCATVEAVAAMLAATGRDSLDAQLLAGLCAHGARVGGADDGTVALLDAAAAGGSASRRAA